MLSLMSREHVIVKDVDPSKEGGTVKKDLGNNPEVP